MRIDLQKENYDKYIFGKKQENVICISKIIGSKDGVWKNISNYDNYETICEITCSQSHNFSLSVRGLKRGSWCPHCIGNHNVGEEYCRIILQELLGFSLLKTRKITEMRSEKGSPLEIDGFNLDHKFGFEYNGKQHYMFIPTIHRKEEKFHSTQYNDNVKKEFFKNKDWKLLIIKEFSNFSLDQMTSIIVKGLDEIGVKHKSDIDLNVVKEKIKNLHSNNYEKEVTEFIKSQGYDVDMNKSSFLRKNDWVYILNGVNSRSTKIETILKYKKNNMDLWVNQNKVGKIKKVKKQKWTKEKVMKIIDLCSSRFEFKDKHKGAFCWSQRNGFYHEAVKNLPKYTNGSRKETVDLTLDGLIEIAKDCTGTQNLKMKDRRYYEYARKIGYLHKLIFKNKIMSLI